jgi:excisionase family DNA binding protein
MLGLDSLFREPTLSMTIEDENKTLIAPPEGGLLRPRDAARYLSISKPSLYRLMARGRIPYLHVTTGGNLREGDRRIPRAALLHFIEAGLVEQSAR